MPDADLVNFIKKLPLIVKNDRPKKAARGVRKSLCGMIVKTFNPDQNGRNLNIRQNLPDFEKSNFFGEWVFITV